MPDSTDRLLPYERRLMNPPVYQGDGVWAGVIPMTPDEIGYRDPYADDWVKDYWESYKGTEIKRALAGAMFLRGMSSEESAQLASMFWRCLSQPHPWLIMGPPAPVK